MHYQDLTDETVEADGEGSFDCVRCGNPALRETFDRLGIDHAYSGNCVIRVK